MLLAVGSIRTSWGYHICLYFIHSLFTLLIVLYFRIHIFVYAHNVFPQSLTPEWGQGQFTSTMFGNTIVSQFLSDAWCTTTCVYLGSGCVTMAYNATFIKIGTQAPLIRTCEPLIPYKRRKMMYFNQDHPIETREYLDLI